MDELALYFAKKLKLRVSERFQEATAHHLAWGYIARPPVTPFRARVALSLSGPSLIGLRSFSVLAEGIVMLLTGLMMRDLGGNR